MDGRNVPCKRVPAPARSYSALILDEALHVRDIILFCGHVDQDSL